MTLKELPIGKTATVRTVGGEGALRQHFLDMGIIPGAEVTMVKYAPMGDPVEVRIHSYELTLRLADAGRIAIDEMRDAVKEKEQPDAKAIPHPGFGEGGKYHNKAEEHPLPEGELLSFALAGNQNCGKTTLFNQLTGARQHVGNFPGVTVDRKDGEIRGQKNTLVTDLPGIYSMSPYSSEEIVTRNFVLNEHPRGIINIVDATNIERNLYLTMQLMELDVPMVLALNMMDEVRENGGSVLVNQMEERLGIPVIPISAAKNEGIEELVAHAVHVAKYQEKPGRKDFCEANDHGGAVHRALHAIMHLIEDHAARADIPVRFAASKLAEGDALILEQLNEQRTVTVQQLCEALHTSESTIRRDLTELDRQGRLTKVHGGATLPDSRFLADEPTMEAKETLAVAEKRSIAAAAAALIAAEDFVFIDAGTTTLELVRALTGVALKATYVTNGVAHARLLAQKGCRVYLPGGLLRPQTEAIVGAPAVSSIQQYNFTKAFMGANGVALEAGFTTPDPEEAAVKAAAVRRARESWFLVDDAKFAKIYPAVITDLHGGAILTNRCPNPKYKQYTFVKEAEA